jgi:hypothetical protein
MLRTRQRSFHHHHDRSHHHHRKMLFNIFRLLGDFSHLLSKGILIGTVHLHKSAEGSPSLPSPISRS